MIAQLSPRTETNLRESDEFSGYSNSKRIVSESDFIWRKIVFAARRDYLQLYAGRHYF